MTAAPLRTTRRGALAGTLAALAVTGCDAVAPLPQPGTEPSHDTPVDPDAELVDRVRADLGAAWLLLTAGLRARPGLAPELAPFVTIHRRHLSALDGDLPTGRQPVRGDAASVRAAVRRREERLRTELESAALAAQSGPLAALLASMSAAVAQQLAVAVDA